MTSLQATITLETFLGLIGQPTLQPWQQEMLDKFIGLCTENHAVKLVPVRRTGPSQKIIGRIIEEKIGEQSVVGKNPPVAIVDEAETFPVTNNEAAEARCCNCGHENDEPAFKSCRKCRDKWRRKNVARAQAKKGIVAAPSNASGGGTALPKSGREKKWTDEKLLEIAAMRESGLHPREIATKMGEGLANIQCYLPKAMQLLRDQRIIPATKAQLISACRMMSAPITVLDGIVRCDGKLVDDAGLLEFTNRHRIKNKLPLYKLGAA